MTTSEQAASVLLFGGQYYECRVKDANFILGDRWVTYNELVAEIEALNKERNAA